MPKTRIEPSSSKKKKTTYATPALDKGLDILELLARQTEGLTKSQLARELDRSISEIFRMLICLERRGYIALVSNDRYALTMKLFHLVQEHPPTERLIADALPAMKRLAHETQQSCHLGVLDVHQVVILAQVNPPTSIGFYVKLGSTVDIMQSASGYVILAHQSAEERERIVSEWRRNTGEPEPEDLERHLDRIRKAGYERRESYLVRGVLNISMPVCDSRGSALGALTIPYIKYNTQTLSERETIQALTRAADEINVALGAKKAAL